MVQVLVQIWSTWTLAIPPAPQVLTASKGLRNWFGGTQSPPLFVLNFSYFILFYFIFLFRFSLILKLIFVFRLFFNFLHFFKFFFCVYLCSFGRIFAAEEVQKLTSKTQKILQPYEFSQFATCENLQVANFRNHPVAQCTFFLYILL